MQLSSSRWRAVVAVPLAIALGATLAGCAESSAQAVKGESIEVLGPDVVPSEVMGLAVNAEPADAVKGAKSAFVDAVGLYSLRSEELLQATLQVSRFTDDAKLDGAFRRGVVQQVGSTTPQAVRMADKTVYLTTGKRQNVAVWFEDRYLFILGTREEYPTPRALLRELLEIEP